MSNLLLGLNIDHVATLRNSRRTIYPDPIYAAIIAEQSGVDSIVLHLREDRRHITDRDVKLIRQIIQIPMNLEIAATDEMIAIACMLKPHSCCLVPEKRQELTTEGGLDIIGYGEDKLRDIISKLTDSDIKTSLFIEPEEQNITAAYNVGASCVELHTGTYANTTDYATQILEYQRIKKSVQYAINYGLQVNAGHGLTYYNVDLIAKLSGIKELNIGHSIISRAIFFGLPQAVKDMKELLKQSRGKQ